MSHQPRSIISAPSLLNTGEETFPRLNVTVNSNTMTTQSLRLVYFTARKSESVNNLAVMTGGTLAAATPTLCRIGLFAVDLVGNLALLVACANDTTLFAAANTLYSRATTATGTKVAGKRYALGVLVVTSVAAPTLVGMQSVGSTAVFGSGIAPRQQGVVGSQSDLPSTVAAGSISDSSNCIWGYVTP